MDNSVGVTNSICVSGKIRFINKFKDENILKLVIVSVFNDKRKGSQYNEEIRFEFFLSQDFKKDFEERFAVGDSVYIHNGIIKGATVKPSSKEIIEVVDYEVTNVSNIIFLEDNPALIKT